jgi:Tfp pilus assembly protein PilV
MLNHIRKRWEKIWDPLLSFQIFKIVRRYYRSWKLEVGSWRRSAPGRRKLEAGSWKLASQRSWKKEAGSRKLGVGVAALLRSFVPHTLPLVPCSSSSPHPLQNKNLSVSAPSAGGKKDISAPLRPLREEIKPTASQRSQRAGFSLIEVVSFVVIVAISFVVLVLVFRNAGDFSMKGDLLTQASQLAVHRMETIRSNNFDGIDTWDEVTTTHGSITVTSYVYYVDPTIDLVTEVAGPTTMKRIVVQASSPETDIVTITSLYYQRPGIVY